jgi:2-oxoglutarate ferredoxin oxidoreductase subunit beta
MASPTSDTGYVTKTTPQGAPTPFNPMAVAIAVDTSFVARGFAGDVDHLADLMKAGITHQGFALIDILQPCPTFNHKNTFTWYRERIYKLSANYDPTDKLAAFAKAQEWGDRIPTGVIYRAERPTFEEQLPALKNGPLVEQRLEPQMVKLMSEFV